MVIQEWIGNMSADSGFGAFQGVWLFWGISTHYIMRKWTHMSFILEKVHFSSFFASPNKFVCIFTVAFKSILKVKSTYVKYMVFLWLSDYIWGTSSYRAASHFNGSSGRQCLENRALFLGIPCLISIILQ